MPAIPAHHPSSSLITNLFSDVVAEKPSVQVHKVFTPGRTKKCVAAAGRCLGQATQHLLLRASAYHHKTVMPNTTAGSDRKLRQ